MSSELSLLSSSKSEEFNLKDIEVLVDGKELHWFKRAHIRQYLGIARITTSTTKLAQEYMRSRAFVQVEGGSAAQTPLRKTNKILICSSHLLVLSTSPSTLKKIKVKWLKSISYRTLYHVVFIQGLQKYKKSINLPSHTVTIRSKSSSMRTLVYKARYEQKISR